MEKIEGYGSYSSSIYEKNRTARDVNTAKAADTKAKSGSGRVSLSRDAQKLLKELNKTYGNAEFMVADYKSDEEAASYLARGTGEYSVLLTPEELEKMAADRNYKAQNLKKLDDAVAKLADVKDQLGAKGEDVKRLGVAIDDGEVSLFAELEKSGEKQRERIERQRESRREERAGDWKERLGKEDGYLREGVKRTVVFAPTADKLAEKIGQVDWSAVKEQYGSAGNHFDFTI